MNLQQLAPSFPEGTVMDEVNVRRDGDTFLVQCRVRVDVVDKRELKAARKHPQAGRKHGEFKATDKKLAYVSDRDKQAVIDFIRERGSATGVEITERFKWDSSRQSTVIRACRAEERIRLVGAEPSGHGRGSKTLRYAPMESPVTEGTFMGAVNGG